jgi:hypothetical protein
MSKPEVCEYLGKSKRTIETFVSRGRLGVSYFAGANGKTAQFRRAEVEALDRELKTPVHRATPQLEVYRPEPARGQDFAGAIATYLAGIVGSAERPRWRFRTESTRATA